MLIDPQAPTVFSFDIKTGWNGLEFTVPLAWMRIHWMGNFSIQKILQG